MCSVEPPANISHCKPSEFKPLLLFYPSSLMVINWLHSPGVLVPIWAVGSIVSTCLSYMFLKLSEYKRNWSATEALSRFLPLRSSSSIFHIIPIPTLKVLPPSFLCFSITLVCVSPLSLHISLCVTIFICLSLSLSCETSLYPSL